MRVEYGGLTEKLRITAEVGDFSIHDQIGIVEDMFRYWFETGLIDGDVRVLQCADGILESLKHRIGGKDG